MIPVHRPQIGLREAENVLKALRAGEISGSSGHFIADFEDAFAEYCGCKYGIAVSSGSTALHLAMALIDIKPGDEVMVSACTNIASAAAVVQQGGVVVPIDSERDTWNMDPSLLEGAITPRTKAIMPVHVYGHPVDMGRVIQVAMRHHLFIIEDCAEAHGAEYRGRKVGSLGDIGCFSFYANKIITTGEGGMLTTDSQVIAERARSLRNLAFTFPRFRHSELGFNYRMTNMQAAVGVAQLENIEQVIRRKRQVAMMYATRLLGMSRLRLPVERDYARNVFWMFCVIVDGDRDALAQKLLESGVETRTMFCPMNLQPALIERCAVRQLPCPVAEWLWTHGMYLPSGCDLTEQDIDCICKVIECALTS